MNIKLLAAAAVAVLSLGAGTAANAEPAANPAVTEAKVSFHFGFYGNPYGYYGPYYGHRHHYYNYGPKCFYNYYGQYVCKYY